MTPNDNLQIVTTPTFAWLEGRAQECRARMIIGSPYVNNGIRALTDLVPKEISRVLVTRTDLRDFAVRASNLDSLCALARDGIIVKSLNNLHAKIYIFDDTALVTSANATVSGMRRNLECGLATTNKPVVEQLATDLLKGFGSRRYPPPLSLPELEALQEAVAAIRVDLPPAAVLLADPERSADSAPGSTADFSIVDAAALAASLKGWKSLTMRGMLDLPAASFHITELLAICEPMAAGEFPRNTRVRQKLRQQLQFLRDLGLVEFVDNHGNYRRTMN